MKKEDVIIIAKAVVEDAVMFRDQDPYDQGYESGYDCYYCCGELVTNIKYFKHELNCPVLVAKDILTGEKYE